MCWGWPSREPRHAICFGWHRRVHYSVSDGATRGGAHMDSHQHTNLFLHRATREATISRRRHGCAIRVLSMAPASAWNVPCPCKIMQRAGTAATGRALPARLGGARPVGQISETGRNLPCLVREALGKPATRDRSRTQSRIPNASAVVFPRARSRAEANYFAANEGCSARASSSSVCTT